MSHPPPPAVGHPRPWIRATIVIPAPSWPHRRYSTATRPLWNTPFALFWCSRALSTLALHMQTVAVGWQLYGLTGSALDLGLVGLAQFVPTVILTLVVGQVADRYDRRLVVVLCHVAEAGATAALALGSMGG